MRVSLSLRLPLLAAALALSTIPFTGCSGGFGADRPTIAAALANETVNAGQKATFTVTPAGVAPFTYQWYRNAQSIAGATGNSYSLVAQASDNGAEFSVGVTNVAGTTTSQAVLTVNVPPTITTPPANQTINAGQTANFAVTAAGTAPLAYQWYKGGTAIAGATASTFTTPAANVADNGSGYTVLISNMAGNITSPAAMLTVNALAPALSFSPIAAQTYGNQPIAVSAASASPGAVTYSVVSGPATISGNTVSLTGSGTVVLAANQAANGNYAAATAQTSFTVSTETPALTFAPIAAQTYGAQPLQVSATSASSGAVTYSVVSGPATISGSIVSLTGSGTVVLAANQAASGSYAAATAQTTFTVGAETPTLTFAPVTAKTYGAQAFQVSATSASTGAITYSVVSGPATISGSAVTVTGAGTVVLAANQAASGSYAAASAQVSFTVGAETPTLAFAPIATQTYGAQPLAVNATSASSGAVTYSVVSGPATVSGNMVTLTGAGTVMLAANQAASGNYTSAAAQTSFSVGAETPTLTFASTAPQTYGAQPFAVTATSASSGAVTYSVVSGPATVSGNTVTVTGVGTVVLDASQAANGNYAAATATTTFAVHAETPTLVFATVPSQTYGGQPFTVSATSASGGAVTYAVVSGPATVSGSTVTVTGVGTVVLSASQSAAGNYGTALVTTSFTAAAAAPALTFTVANQTYGAQPFQVAAASPSSGAISYAVVSGPATVTGSAVTLTGVGPVVLSATQAANGNYTTASVNAQFTVSPETPNLVFMPIATKTYGNSSFAALVTDLSPGAVTLSVLSGPATVAGFNVTITGTGTVVLKANQAASADGDYAATSAQTSFLVVPATPTLSLPSIPPQFYGAPPFTVTGGDISSGTVTYTVASGPATISGNTVTITGTGTVVLNASQAASADGDYAASSAQTSFTVNAATPALAFATIPAQTFGNQPFPVSASSASSGAVSYSVVSGPATISGSTVTITGAGTVVLQANQAASTDGDYTATSTTVNVPVASNVTLTPITPANITIAPGQQTYTATATGGVSDNINWSASAGSFSGNVWTAPNTPGTYTITATSADESSVTQTTQVTVSAPVITQQPVSKNACSGYNPSFNTAANYATSYQWYLNGNSLGVNSPTLTFNNVTNASNGTYTCTAINAAGTATSNAVTLNVVNPTTLAITSQPASVTVYATQTATFSAGVNGTGTLTYQWYTGTPGSGAAITGATSSSYTTGALTTANSGTTYYVMVSDPDCTGSTVTSNAATLTVSGTDTAVPPTIVVQPMGETATVGGTATFTVTASGSGTLSYQWFRVPFSSTELSNPTAGVLISGATSSSYTVPASETAQSNDGDNYYVVVNNAYGQAVSSRVVLAVGAGIVLQLNSEPQSQYIAAGTLASFSVTATCTGCIPAYQWYWYAPGSNSATPVTNGAVSTGTLSGATVAGATSSSLTLQNVPATATGGIFYVVVTSTSDGSSQISGTNPLTSSTAGLFVGSLGTIGGAAAGNGLCNSTSNWVLNGNTPGTSSGDVPYQNTSACKMELVNDQGNERAAVYWPTLISTAKFSVSFTVTMAATSTPADGFTMVLADPSQGATTSTIGAVGEGIGANGIPGFVLGFDTYQNGDGNAASGCYWQSPIPCDPAIVPYMAVGQGASALWENPWTFVNGDLNTQSSTDYSPATFANSSHNYVVTVVNKVMTVTMDGYELFTGTVSLPPAAYLGFTASTGGSEESVTISNLTATVSAP